ncbi:MAG: hypothetical protein JWO60_2548 [Frankiales bacterium]|nr:hypothetical protein [Frankiales bacterium]
MVVKSYLVTQWDRTMAWVAVGLGLLALLVGWIGVSRTGFVFEQLPYVVSGGIGGLFLLGVGAMLWLSADLRDEWRKLDVLEQVLRELPAPVLAEPDVELYDDEPVAGMPEPRRRPSRARTP